MTKRIILSIAMLLFIAGGVWIACDEATLAPPAAPSAASADKGWTATGSGSSAEVTLNPDLVASQRRSPGRRFAVAMTHLRLKDKYGEGWDEVANLIRAIAVLKGDHRRVSMYDEMLDPLKLTQHKAEFPTRSVAHARAHAGRVERAWESGRKRIRASGRLPVPPSYDQMVARENRMTAEDRTTEAIEALTAYAESLKTDTASIRRARGGGSLLSISVLAVGAPMLQGRGCRANCHGRASAIYWVAIGICTDEFHDCCQDEGGCVQSPPNAAHETCEDGWEDCWQEAYDAYDLWYHRCLRLC